MRASSFIRLLEAVLDLAEHRLRRGGGATSSDLLRLGRQRRRLNRLHIQLAARKEARRFRPRDVA